MWNYEPTVTDRREVMWNYEFETACFAVNSERQPRQLYPFRTFNTAYVAASMDLRK